MEKNYGNKKKNKISDSGIKSINYHIILGKILESFRHCQNDGLQWDLMFSSNETRRVNFVFPLCICVVDMKGARQLCGMYDTGNVQRPCISCYAKSSDLHFGRNICKPIIASHMKKKILGGKFSQLQQLSQHSNSSNAFFDIDMGGWKHGIWGICPSEILHQFYEGIVIYALEEFLDQFLTKSYRENLDIGVQKIISCISEQSSKDLFPTGVFTLGVTRLKTMKGIEKFACVFYLALFLNTDVSKTEFFAGEKPMKRMERLNEVILWKKLFETMCFYHDWMMKKKFSRIELKGKHKRITNFYELFQKLVKRDGKGIQNIPKFHEFFHITRNIEWHGPPTGYSTLITESNHRPVKSVSRHTQKHIESFPQQTAQRLFERNVIESTYDFVNSFAKDLYMRSCERKNQYDRKHEQISSIMADKDARLGLFYAVYNASTQQVSFSYNAATNTSTHNMHLKNFDFSNPFLIQFFQRSIFHILEIPRNTEYVSIPCFTTLVRKKMKFRGYSRDVKNFSGWAMFQWEYGVENTKHVPGKIITFIDFSTVVFQEKFRGLYPNNELHVIIESLSRCPSESLNYANKDSLSICGNAVLQQKNGYPCFYCVSTSTIYDTTLVIPNLNSVLHNENDNRKEKYLYVFPRLYYEDSGIDNEEICDHSENEDEESNDYYEVGGWANKF